ncbi:MAG: hypothetical protein ACRDP6_13135 [Actinoallomurus sp.]
MIRRRLQMVALAALPIFAVACGGGTEATAPRAAQPPPSPPASAPTIRPADFIAKVDNPWFPLTPGTTLTYKGVKDGKPTVDKVVVTDRTTVVDGVPSVALRDNLYEGGNLEERTTDWYAQDRQGNVWYFGEETAELDPKGHVTSTEGSWQAGKDGAQPGIFMPAHPTVGQTGRQEYLNGHAEDHFQILRFDAAVQVPAVSSDKALLTKEWTPIEPSVIDHKYYVRGIGTVLEQSVTGPKETNALVSVTRGR